MQQKLGKLSHAIHLACISFAKPLHNVYELLKDMCVALMVFAVAVPLICILDLVGAVAYDCALFSELRLPHS